MLLKSTHTARPLCPGSSPAGRYSCSKPGTAWTSAEKTTHSGILLCNETSSAVGCIPKKLPCKFLVQSKYLTQPHLACVELRGEKVCGKWICIKRNKIFQEEKKKANKMLFNSSTKLQVFHAELQMSPTYLVSEMFPSRRNSSGSAPELFKGRTASLEYFLKNLIHFLKILMFLKVEL